MTYNLLNLPATSVKNVGTDNEITTEWSYLADGTKMAAYVSLYVDVADDADGPQLESVASVGGRFVMAIDPYSASFTAQQRYFITDHLGSTRIVLDKVGSVLERYDYYPYGEKIPVTVASSGNTDYLYTGKESQNALFGINWYDSGARFQTTDGIFTGIDPLAEKYYHLSPYAYCAGNPVNVIDPLGLTHYLVEGEEYDIDDGYDETLEVSRREYDRLVRRNARGNGGYDRLRSRIMDRNGFVDGEGNPVLAASYVSPSYATESALNGFCGVVVTDLVFVDASDGSPYKWGAYAVTGAVLSTAYLTEKMAREIANLMKRSPGPQGWQYALVAKQDGLYPDVRGGMVHLTKGDVWKYGESIHPDIRYPKIYLRYLKLEMDKQVPGSQKEIKIVEKEKLYNYYFENGHLPPGNKRFR